MKKFYVFMFLLVSVFIFSSCTRNNIEIPSLEEIKTKYYDDDIIEREIRKCDKESLIKKWGEPDRSIEYENEDVWLLDERRVIVVSYNFLDQVVDVDIED